jgi:hypothetical protein
VFPDAILLLYKKTFPRIFATAAKQYQTILETSAAPNIAAMEPAAPQSLQTPVRHIFVSLKRVAYYVSALVPTVIPLRQPV